ncbi:MAG: malate dehydrogenase, partial [Candidatus Nitrosotenuis sp.]
TIVDAILKDRKKVIPVATPLAGEYGQSNVSIGVPAVIGRKGVEKIIELDLDAQEKEMFLKGIESVKSALAGI